MQALAFILNVVTIIFSIVFLYMLYCIIDLIILKSQVKKGNTDNVSKLHFNILRFLMKIKGKIQSENKKKFIRATNKFCFIGIIVEFFAVVLIIASIALFNVLQNIDNSIVSISSAITSVFEEENEEDTSKVDSDTTTNSWVSTKDDWRYNDQSDEYKNGDYAGIYNRPGTASGPLAITLNDGSYFWYHQSSSCLTCKYCGSWSGMTWGGAGGDRHLLAKDGCGVYSMAIAVSNLKGTAITPKDILLACESNIDEATNDCTTTPPYFDGRGLYWYEMPEKIAETYDINIQTVEHTTAAIDEILNKGGYVWFWMNSSNASNWPWSKSEGHFILIRKHDGENYYCFDECDNEAAGFPIMNTPVKKSEVIAVMKDTRAVGLWVDRTYNSTRNWYSSALTVDNATSSIDIGGGIKLYNGLPWEAKSDTYVADCEAMLYDMVDYINTVSTEQVNIDLDKILSKSRMLNTSAGLNKKTGKPVLQGDNWISTVTGSKITSYCTIEGVNCVGVCVPCTVADPTYNMQFADGRWQTKSTPPNSVYGYSTQKLAAILRNKSDGSIMYLPCSHIDAKGHTFPGGLAQTNVKLLSGNADESGKVVSFNVQVATNWSGSKYVNETWTLAQLGYKMNSKLINEVSTPVSPASMVDNIAEFWHVNTEAWDAIKSNYQVLGFVVWPNGT